MIPGNARIQVFRIGSWASQAYRVTAPVYAFTTAFTEFRR